MNQEEFEHTFETVVKVCREMLVEKAKEYAEGDVDRLHNFHLAAGLSMQTKEQALAGMMVKHTVSIYDMVRSGKTYSLSKWDEKIVDHINYLILLRACVVDGIEDVDQKLPFSIPEDQTSDNRVTVNQYFQEIEGAEAILETYKHIKRNDQNGI